MPSSGSLEQLQRWLLDAITCDVTPAHDQVTALLLPGPAQSPAERLAVYRHAYVVRLLEVLRELFPCTRFSVGDEVFDAFMAGYLRACPPRSYTLAQLADRLVEHLNATRPADFGEFVVELVRLEQAIDRVFDGPGGEDLPPLTLPQPLTGSLKLSFVPGFELLEFRYPVSSLYSDWKAGRKPDWPQPRMQYVALIRRDYVVRRHELAPSQYVLLRALAAAASVGEALTAVVEADDDPLTLPARLAAWFQFWAGERFFSTAY